MSKVLYIKANIKPEGQSRTFKISDKFIEEYKKQNPEDEIITLDLYKENINFLNGEDLEAVYGPKNDNSKNHPVLKYAYEFAEADKYIISAPMWNLSTPSILNAYMDYVSATGITFKYTERGPVGLCNGKKAIHIVSRGGKFSKGPAAMLEMGDRYLKSIFAFFGITDFTSIVAEGLDVIGQDVESIIEDKIKEAQVIAKEF